MLVQDRSAPKPSRPERSPRKSKILDPSSWTSDNSSRFAIVLLLVVTTVAAVFFLPSIGDTAALLCFERSHSTPNPSSLIDYPRIDWNKIPPLPPLNPTSPFASFRSDRWIVVSVSSHPTPSLQRLARVKGWQLLAGVESPDSVAAAARPREGLAASCCGQLPHSSRLSVGYLFAIRHGARKIFDADDRADVLGDGDLGRHFDLELIGEVTSHPVLLQYSHHDPNRTVVNPYVHFGQRSVWPRGLPLENVGEVGHEEFYTEVFSGKQFIQQGLSNGLPDVDSVFYFTRKSSGLEAFDIRFDDDAPKVALPQGTMVPVNSFNTLFHSQAFWGLMLPVSISSMASDVLRGYWAQRILWEIGGFVAVYPPTIHRVDNAQSYPFAEEKDLHVNVGRLIKFLLSWRSNKPTLFERILHLSYAMAEEGFWTELDVKFTAAWLQDLLSVGYQQPRLMSLELDRPRATIGHGDRREFVPKKLPSVHLGVEEVGTVNYEIGNLIRWRKNFGNVVLVMYCSGPVERTALEWRLLYGRIFKTVIILSEQKNVDLVVEDGQLSHAYKYLPKVFERYAGAEGFLFLQDNMILNYWNLLQANKGKLWITNKVSKSWVSVTIDENSSKWFKKQAALVKQVVNNFPVHFQVSYKETMPEENKLIICGSEIFYIPQRHAGDFTDLVGLLGDMNIHHKVAVPMFFLAMDSPQNYDSEALSNIVYSPEKPANSSLANVYSTRVPAVYPLDIHDEIEFIKLIRVMSSGDPLLMELV
ncbi:uncharacterized protein A4U43_C02F14520 [Asparagus officinalis]|uniref:Uncharacterized protein n=1 Tax=Asparagus officinalis TaxID=4686 RepID=A0A5P1FIH8_ASPOF|nr:uncharacterized protein A4U43_C02F14520 [Asparagus officinalis]